MSNYKDNPDYMTQTEALRYLGMFQLTFYRHTGLLGIKGTREGRCTYYLRSDIERLKAVRSNLFTNAIGVIEREAGKKVKEIVFED